MSDKAARLPLKPGIYLMKDSSGKIIYIGKAKALKNRVSSYFQNIFKLGQKTFKLVENIDDFDFIVTDSELDALILEARFIKMHRPKYNILLKDDKGLNYFKISGTQYPKLTHSFDTNDKNALYIGPFSSSHIVKTAVDEANKIFMLPVCNKKFPQEFGKERPCLNFHIKKCIGVCAGGISPDEYQAMVNNAVEYIKTGSKKSVEELNRAMLSAAEELRFERAARLRDQIKAIEKARTIQKIETSKTTPYDVIGFSEPTESGKICAVVIKYRDGRITDKVNFIIEEHCEPPQRQREFMREYYENPDSLPREIYIDCPLAAADKDLIEQYFSQHAKKKVTVINPKRGEFLTQITLAQSNANEYIAVKTGRVPKEIRALEGLKTLLGLKETPLYIESYDISNLGESIKVGGMVTYRDGKPFKAGYRKFTIKDVDGRDDYACMSDVVRRRFLRLLDGDVKFNQKPNLILVDGGKGHVSAIKAVLEEVGMSDIALFGMVKDEKHRTKAISHEDGEIQINANKQVFALVTQIQNEVHRFSIEFQRKSHKKKTFETSLTKIKGIGPQKAAALMKHFKTKQRLKEATLEELMKVAKISEKTAKQLTVDN